MLADTHNLILRDENVEINGIIRQLTSESYFLRVEGEVWRVITLEVLHRIVSSRFSFFESLVSSLFPLEKGD